MLVTDLWISFQIHPKKEQFDKMKDDLEVKKLERDVELVLDSRLRVNSTKE